MLEIEGFAETHIVILKNSDGLFNKNCGYSKNQLSVQKKVCGGIVRVLAT